MTSALEALAVTFSFLRTAKPWFRHGFWKIHIVYKHGFKNHMLNLNRCVLFPNEFSYWKRFNWIENINNFEFKINKDDIVSCCSSDNFNISRSDFLFCYGVLAKWSLPAQFCRISFVVCCRSWVLSSVGTPYRLIGSKLIPPVKTSYKIFLK